MKAIVGERYGSPDVLEYRDVEKPSPKDDELLIEVRAASVNAYDWHLLRADPFLVRISGLGFWKPKHKIPGADVAGKVIEVGKKVTKFAPGDEVYADMAANGNGAFAEYACSLERLTARKPEMISFEEAAALPIAAITALQGLRDVGELRAGQSVIINGASGGVGMYAVQIAKALGAEVTGVCSSKNLELVKSVGADHVIDYTKEDFTRGGKQYDFIFAVNGYHSLGDYSRALKPTGIYAMAGGTNRQIFQSLFLNGFYGMFSSRKFRIVHCRPKPEDFEFLNELLETGKLKSVVDRVFSLEEVPEAIRYMEDVHPSGKLVIRVSEEVRG